MLRLRRSRRSSRRSRALAQDFARRDRRGTRQWGAQAELTAGGCRRKHHRRSVELGLALRSAALGQGYHRVVRGLGGCPGFDASSLALVPGAHEGGNADKEQYQDGESDDRGNLATAVVGSLSGAGGTSGRGGGGGG